MFLALVVPSIAATCADTVRINEFSANTGSEYVELYASEATDISGWTFEYGTSSFSHSVTVPDGTSLAAGGFYVIGSPGAPYKDFEQSMDFGNASSSAD